MYVEARERVEIERDEVGREMVGRQGSCLNAAFQTQNGGRRFATGVTICPPMIAHRSSRETPHTRASVLGQRVPGAQFCPAAVDDDRVPDVLVVSRNIRRIAESATNARGLARTASFSRIGQFRRSRTIDRRRGAAPPLLAVEGHLGRSARRDEPLLLERAPSAAAPVLPFDRRRELFRIGAVAPRSQVEAPGVMRRPSAAHREPMIGTQQAVVHAFTVAVANQRSPFADDREPVELFCLLAALSRAGPPAPGHRAGAAPPLPSPLDRRAERAGRRSRDRRDTDAAHVRRHHAQPQAMASSR